MSLSNSSLSAEKYKPKRGSFIHTWYTTFYVKLIYPCYFNMTKCRCLFTMFNKIFKRFQYIWVLNDTDSCVLCNFSYLKNAVDSSCNKESCNSEDLPRTYISYHLNGKSINIDGKLDEPAWEEVSWTDSFMGINIILYNKLYINVECNVNKIQL